MSKILSKEKCLFFGSLQCYFCCCGWLLFSTMDDEKWEFVESVKIFLNKKYCTDVQKFEVNNLCSCNPTKHQNCILCNKIPPSHFLELCIYQRSLSLLMSVSNFLWHTHFEELFNFLLNWEEGKSQGKSNKSFSSATNYCWPTTFFFSCFSGKHKFHFWIFFHLNKWENHIGQKK